MPPEHRYRILLDRMGAFGSLLCAVHCALLPLLIALLPSIGVATWLSKDAEEWFVVFASMVGLFSVVWGYRRHREVRALGLFKAEIQEDFLTIVESGEVFDISHASGINPRLIDKGALLLEHGPLLYAVDRQGNEAKFWLDDFLQAMRVPDTSTSSKVVAEVLEQISEEIDDPQEQVRFKDEVMNLCKTEPELSPRQMGSMAERYVGPEEVGRLFDNAAESYGFSLESDAPLPAQSVAKRLEKSWSKVGIGHGVSLLLPSDLSLQNVRSVKGENGELTLTLFLQQKED